MDWKFCRARSSISISVEIFFSLPILIWTRMTWYVENPHLTERLSFPLIIMRIFRRFGIDTRSSSYQHSLGTINDSTIVKSLPCRPDDTPTPPKATRPSASTPTPVAPSAPTTPPVPTPTVPPIDTSEDDASVTSIYREQQRLPPEKERISLDLQRITAD